MHIFRVVNIDVCPSLVLRVACVFLYSILSVMPISCVHLCWLTYSRLVTARDHKHQPTISSFLSLLLYLRQFSSPNDWLIITSIVSIFMGPALVESGLQLVSVSVIQVNQQKASYLVYVGFEIYRTVQCAVLCQYTGKNWTFLLSLFDVRIVKSTDSSSEPPIFWLPFCIASVFWLPCVMYMCKIFPKIRTCGNVALSFMVFIVLFCCLLFPTQQLRRTVSLTFNLHFVRMKAEFQILTVVFVV